MFGRSDYANIALGLGNKTPDEVKKYSDHFWKKYHLIENGQKYVERIEKGELEIEKQRQIFEAIEFKLSSTNK